MMFRPNGCELSGSGPALHSLGFLFSRLALRTLDHRTRHGAFGSKCLRKVGVHQLAGEVGQGLVLTGSQFREFVVAGGWEGNSHSPVRSVLQFLTLVPFSLLLSWPLLASFSLELVF